MPPLPFSNHAVRPSPQASSTGCTVNSGLPIPYFRNMGRLNRSGSDLITAKGLTLSSGPAAPRESTSHRGQIGTLRGPVGVLIAGVPGFQMSPNENPCQTKPRLSDQHAFVVPATSGQPGQRTTPKGDKRGAGVSQTLAVKATGRRCRILKTRRGYEAKRFGPSRLEHPFFARSYVPPHFSQPQANPSFAQLQPSASFSSLTLMNTQT